MQLQGFLKASGGRWILPGLLVHHAEFVESPGLAEPVAELPPQLKRLALVRQGGGIVPGQPPRETKFSQRVGLVER